jgi:fatty acid desaturase
MKFNNESLTIDKPSEFINLKDKINNNETSYFEFKKKLKVYYPKVYLLTLLPILTLVLVISATFFIEKNFTQNFFSTITIVIFLSIIIGLIFHHIQNIIHAAIHNNLHKNLKINDFIANILGLFTASEINEVKKIHWKHHKFVGTYDDPESSYLYPLNLKKIIFYFLGVAMVQYALGYSKQTSENAEKNFINKILSLFTLHRTFSLIFHLTCLSFFYFYLQSSVISFSWIYAFFALLPFFNSMQNILEHAETRGIRNSRNYKIKPVNRNFASDIFSKYIYGNFGSNKHALHHWDPSIHYSSLDEVCEFLEQSNFSETIKNHKSKYLEALKKILK